MATIALPLEETDLLHRITKKYKRKQHVDQGVSASDLVMSMEEVLLEHSPVAAQEVQGVWASGSLMDQIHRPRSSRHIERVKVRWIMISRL